LYEHLTGNITLVINQEPIITGGLKLQELTLTENEKTGVDIAGADIDGVD